MRLYASNELKSRLTHAAANGSVIAADILSELKKNIVVFIGKGLQVIPF